METIQEVLSGLAENKTLTRTNRLNQSRFDTEPEAQKHSGDISITQTIARSSISDFSKPINVCEVCGDPLQLDIVILDKLRRMPISCKCRKEARERERLRDEYNELQRKLNRFKAYSLMDERFVESTFENWKFRSDNRQLFEFGKRYCDNWATIKSNNRGLLIHGIAGNGKTYLAFAIANELYKRGIAVLAISVSRILKIIIDSYENHGNIGEMDVLSTLYDASLLILDDLGVESKTQWSYEKLYSIIDTRYRARKPTIITTNLHPDELRENLSIVDARLKKIDPSNRIYSRIVEMCAFIKTEGESWRIQKGMENKLALFNELGMSRGTNE